MMKKNNDCSVVSFKLPDAPEIFREVLWEAEISERGLRRLSFTGPLSANAKLPKKSAGKVAPEESSPLSPFKTKFLAKLKRKLLGRLNGGSDDFEWDEFDLNDAGDFHVRVWQAMREIPSGKTATYGETAARAGSPMAFRACGQACGANRILIFIPCHRVVAASGMGGFGYGLEWKKRLLEAEGAA